MRPKKPETTGEGDLFRARLEQIIDLKHELVQAWPAEIDCGIGSMREIAPLYYSDEGPPRDRDALRASGCRCFERDLRSCPTRAWASAGSSDPYFQHFAGEEFLPARVPARALGPEPLAEAAWRQAGSSPGRELAQVAQRQVGALRTQRPQAE